MHGTQPGDDPGDLSRRVAARRRELGLTTDEVAQRAGMDPTYLDHVERRADMRPSPAATARLAAALQTSITWLRGGGVDLPPGHGSRPREAPTLDILDRAECLRLVHTGGIGRAVFLDAERMMALPVNFRMWGEDVVFRTGEGVIAEAVRADRPMSLEVDHLDEALVEGWSVLLSGHAAVMDDPGELARVEELHIEPWAGGDRHLVVRFTPDTITGRRIRHLHDPTSGGTATSP